MVFNGMEAGKRSSFQRWAPVLFVLTFVGLVIVVLYVSATSLIASRPQESPPAPPQLSIEQYEPVAGDEWRGLDQYGNPIPQRVEVKIGVYPVEARNCSTLSLPRTDPFCNNMSDRALTDRHVADYMARHAAEQIAPGSIGAVPMSKDANHWLLQVVQAPVDEGGPNLANRSRFTRILTKWLDDDYSDISEECKWLRSLLD